MPSELESVMPVKDIAPIVAYLCHDSFEENGSIIETFGGWVTKVKVQQGKGVVLKKPHTMEDGEMTKWISVLFLIDFEFFNPLYIVRDNWSSICDMTESRYPTAASGMFEIIFPNPALTMYNNFSPRSILPPSPLSTILHIPFYHHPHPHFLSFPLHILQPQQTTCMRLCLISMASQLAVIQVKVLYVKKTR